MKATELNCKSLMIGDWVTCENEKIQVTDIYQQGSQYYVNNDDTPVRDIEPIPLTPEILERNGFKYFEDANAYILMTDDLDCVVLTLNGLTVIFHWHDIPIMCVHQLQHILKLVGINKDITLSMDNFLNKEEKI